MTSLTTSADDIGPQPPSALRVAGGTQRRASDLCRASLVIGIVVSLVFACAKEQAKPKPLSVPGEKVYTLKGTIVGRDTGDNTLRVDHLEIPGYMEAMTMDYSVRGAEVAALPPDKTPIEAKLHVINDGYWLTDVRKVTP